MAKISRKIIKIAMHLGDKAWFMVIISLIINLNFPHFAVAQGFDMPATKIQETSKNGSLPEIGERKPYLVTKIGISAYNSQPNQTDDSPCITASGLDVCARATEDIIATNFLWLPFGTKVRFPELFGEQVFIIHDRMNKKYTKTMDIWMQDYGQAVKFGRQADG